MKITDSRGVRAALSGSASTIACAFVVVLVDPIIGLIVGGLIYWALEPWIREGNDP